MELLQAAGDRRGIVLDPRTKMLVMLTIVIFVIGGTGMLPESLLVMLSVFPLLLLCTAGKWIRAAAYGTVFAAAELYICFGTGQLPSAPDLLLTMCCVIITRILPGLIMGAYLFSSTTVSEFNAAMDRMHVSRKISIPLSVMFRFFPTVAEEFDSINRAMRMRDIRLGGQNVSKMFEYRMVPLLVCSVNIGSELSAAALTRGLSPDEKRTNICEIGFHVQDLIVILLMLVPYGAAVLQML